MKKLLITLATSAIAAMTAAAPALASAREEARLIEASGVLEELFAQKDTAIPERLMSRAYGVAVIPNVVKVAAVVGGRRGSGAMVVRDANGKFTDPIMVTLTGGNIGWQIGVQSTDIVLVFTTAKGIEGITDGKLTLGGDASVAAGPVGRAASAATDQTFSAEVYSYSRNRGLFAGVSLDGSVLNIDNKSNKSLYGKSAPAADIIARKVSTDAEAARRFERAILVSTAGHNPAAPASASSAKPAPDAAAAQGMEDPAAAAPAGATTFPMEDKQPGSEPPH
ncbi:MAG TPA: lipid-binding SYLF domain-containing protein [Steroidobacteraceae bacterium]|jgi:lipid-binding SYLF domain-containing protein|nr:lipid-binding SYLF domain-containing protein [Steroidobacteraceae bacterium]